MWNTSSAEDVSISEVLGGEITDRESGKDALGSSIYNLLKFVVDNLPLGIDNLLEVFWIVKSDLSTVLLSLKLEFDVQGEYPGVCE